ncbi:MAG: MBL fold metallo-hydrolase [Planctomycetota bacterium]
MWFEQIIRRETGCATYLVGSSTVPECLVFDPLWDPTPYMKCATRQKSKIRYVADSHSHADHVSGARRLVARSDAELLIPELADVDYPCRRVRADETITIGEVECRFIHTPGHRPEQFSLLVTDHSRGAEPWMMLTADFLMVGDLARPDLAQDGTAGACVIYDKALPVLAQLPDHVEIYPGHVAGST